MTSWPPRELIDGPTLTTERFRGVSAVDFVRDAFAEAPIAFFDRLWRDHRQWGGALEGMYDYFDIVVLWAMIRRQGVRTVLECSPFRGWSTIVMQKALEGRDATHVSFDILDGERRIRRNMARHVEPRGWRFVRGDFRTTVERHLDLLQNVDLLFIDSDHGEAFARWYLDDFRLLDRVGPSCLVQIHDIYPRGLTPPVYGESPYVVQWLAARRERYEILSTWEVSRLADVVACTPPRALVDHDGGNASNCSLWLSRRSG